jgi:hypothetical protein
MDDERRLRRQRVDPLHRRAQRSGDVLVRRLMEADVTVADLDEREPALIAAAAGGGFRRRADETRARERVDDSGSRPADVMEEISAFQSAPPLSVSQRAPSRRRCERSYPEYARLSRADGWRVFRFCG